MRLSTDVLVSQFTLFDCCDQDGERLLCLSELHRSRSLLLVFFAFSRLLMVGFAIHVDTELFLGVGLSNNRVILA